MVHGTVEIGKSDFCRATRKLEELLLHLSAKEIWREFPLPQQTSVFPLEAFNWLDKAHPYYRGLLLYSVWWFKCESQLKFNFTGIPIVTLDQMSGCYNPWPSWHLRLAIVVQKTMLGVVITRKSSDTIRYVSVGGVRLRGIMVWGEAWAETACEETRGPHSKCYLYHLKKKSIQAANGHDSSCVDRGQFHTNRF